MLAEAVTIPNWGQNNWHRLGKAHRRNRDRFLYIPGYGWFVHTRDEFRLQGGMEIQGGLHGPFKSRENAKIYLDRLIAAAKNCTQQEH